MLVNDLALLLDLFGNSEERKLLICTAIFVLVFTASPKWKVELRAKIGHYRNRCLHLIIDKKSNVREKNSLYSSER